MRALCKKLEKDGPEAQEKVFLEFSSSLHREIHFLSLYRKMSPFYSPSFEEFNSENIKKELLSRFPSLFLYQYSEVLIIDTLKYLELSGFQTFLDAIIRFFKSFQSLNLKDRKEKNLKEKKFFIGPLKLRVLNYFMAISRFREEKNSHPMNTSLLLIEEMLFFSWILVLCVRTEIFIERNRKDILDLGVLCRELEFYAKTKKSLKSLRTFIEEDIQKSEESQNKKESSQKGIQEIIQDLSFLSVDIQKIKDFPHNRRGRIDQDIVITGKGESFKIFKKTLKYDMDPFVLDG